MAHILLSEIVSTISENIPYGAEKGIVIKEKLPGAKNSKVKKQYKFDDFVKKFGEKGVDYSRGLQGNTPTVGNYGKPGAGRKFIPAGTGHRLPNPAPEKPNQLGRQIGSSHPIYDLIQKVEKGLNNGLSAEEADLAYARTGRHHVPIFIVAYTQLSNSV